MGKYIPKKQISYKILFNEEAWQHSWKIYQKVLKYCAAIKKLDIRLGNTNSEVNYKKQIQNIKKCLVKKERIKDGSYKIK